MIRASHYLLSFIVSNKIYFCKKKLGGFSIHLYKIYYILRYLDLKSLVRSF